MSANIRRVLANLLIEENMRVLGAFNGEFSYSAGTTNYTISSPASGKTTLTICQAVNDNYSLGGYEPSHFILGSGSVEFTCGSSSGSSVDYSSIEFSVSGTSLTVKKKSNSAGTECVYSILVLEVEE